MRIDTSYQNHLNSRNAFCSMLPFVQQMVDAIHTRRSHRHYYPWPLDSNDKFQVQSFINRLDPPFSHSVIVGFHEAPPNTDIVYFKGPKHFLSLSSPPTILEQANLGFIGELIVLYAESIGIKTCWMGHYKKHQVMGIVHPDAAHSSGTELYCIITLGYIPEKTGIMDRFSAKRMSKKDKPIESFLHATSVIDPPDSILRALAMASRAPSAMNSQRWYYLVSDEEDGYVVQISKLPGYRHFKWPHYNIDVGTAAAHFWLGLVSQGITPLVTTHEDSDCAVWTFHIA